MYLSPHHDAVAAALQLTSKSELEGFSCSHRRLKQLPAPRQGKSLEDRVAAAGGVPEALVGALRAVLDDAGLDGAFVAAAISLPSASELIDDIPGVDPIVLHDVRRGSASTVRSHSKMLWHPHCLHKVPSFFLLLVWS